MAPMTVNSRVNKTGLWDCSHTAALHCGCTRCDCEWVWAGSMRWWCSINDHQPPVGLAAAAAT